MNYKEELQKAKEQLNHLNEKLQMLTASIMAQDAQNLHHGPTPEFKRGYESAKSEMSGGVVSPEDLLEQAKGDFDKDDFYRGWVQACEEALENPTPKKPANPVLRRDTTGGNDNYTLRDKIAIAAMPTFAVEEVSYDRVAEWSYKMADAMLKAREL